MASALFEHIAALHAPRAWGRILDAGAGVNSVRWMAGLPGESLTAVTGSPSMARTVERAAGGRLKPEDRLITGNWSDPELLKGERFDTVIADYLIGAMDAFSPYAQDLIFDRLKAHARGRLYITGLEPYVLDRPSTPAGAMVCEIGRLRDACLLLAGERPYREFPAEWVVRHLERGGWRVIDVKRFPIRYRAKFVDGQLDMCAARAARLTDPALRTALEARIAALRGAGHAMAEAEGGLRHGADYVIAAEPA